MSVHPTRRPGSLRGLAVLTAVALAMLIGAQAAAAAVQTKGSGKRGQWTLVDTALSPAVTCTYDAAGGAGNDLDVMEARSPRVFARDRTNRRDGQWVAIRLIFQRSALDGGNGGWVTGKQTAFIKKLAHDDTAVSIGRRGWQAEYAGSPHFRVLAKVRWYKPGSKTVVAGAATLRYQWYDTGSGAEMDRCLPEP